MEVIFFMKKTLLYFAVFFLISGIMSACSAIEEVNNSINYIEKATEYINKISTFANEAPTLIEKATTENEALKQLDTKITEIEKEVKEFNQLTPPEFAKDIHAQILEHNQALESAIESYQNSIEEGTFDPKVLQNSELMNQLEAISRMLEQVQNLGN